MRFPKKFRWPAVLVAVCVLLVGTVFALDDLLKRSIDSDAGLQAVREEGKGVELDLSADIDQFTIEIQWGYADDQRISLGYLIRAHDAHRYTNFEIIDATLTLPDASTLPLHQAAGIPQLMEDNQGAGVLEGDLAGITLPDELSGTLSLRLAYAHTDHRTAVPLPASGAYVGRFEDWMLQTASVAFDLNLPVEVGYTAQPNLSAEDAGIEMTLREFRVAPSLGYARVCFTPPDRLAEEGWQWGLQNVTLAYNGAPLLEQVGGAYIDGCADIRLAIGLPLAPGQWTLTIHELHGQRTRLPDSPALEATVTAAGGEFHELDGNMSSLSLPEGASEAIGWSERITGAWIFTFDAP